MAEKSKTLQTMSEEQLNARHAEKMKKKKAANVFRDMPVKRKNELLRNLLRMAFVDESFHDNEKDMIARIARTLGYSEEKIRSLI